MDAITHDDISDAIDDFLNHQLEAKLEPELKKLNKAEPDSDQALKIEDNIQKLRERFSRPVWLGQAATKMARQLKFGTHIAKGVHPDSKGDNVNFRSGKTLPEGLVGTQLLTTPELDANGNAAALPLAAFFNQDVKGIKLRDLILSDHPALSHAFNNDDTSSDYAQKAFKAALAGEVAAPTSFERNKQLLWPLDDAITEDRYQCLIPLHPSSLTHHVQQTINERRFSEANKEARKNRGKKTAEQTPYVSIVNLANTQLGGTKPQNVSLLTSKQGGRNYLLESLPPCYQPQYEFSINKRQGTFFDRQLAYHCYQGLEDLYAVVEAPKSVMPVREQRKQALSTIIGQIMQLAAYVQQYYPAGWSETSALNMRERYWLDPHRAELDEQDSFKEEREKYEWVRPVMEDFSRWLNDQLRKRFKQQAEDFNDAEYVEWLREIEAMVKASQRTHQGAFA